MTWNQDMISLMKNHDISTDIQTHDIMHDVMITWNHIMMKSYEIILWFHDYES